MRRLPNTLIATVGAVALLTVLPATALAGPAPAVENETASNVTATDATLEAQINPGTGEDGFALETTYEVLLEAPSCLSHGFGFCESTGGFPIAKGVIPAGSSTQQVSVDVADAWHPLTPGTIYGYKMVATNEAGARYGEERTFTTLPAPPGKAPVIESVSISHLTPTDGTLEARIDTEGLSTSYEFLLWSSPCSKKGAGCELLIDVPLPSGLLLGSFVAQSVSLDLNSAGVTLGGGEYGFSVRAANKAGGAETFGGTFEAPPGVIDPPKPGAAPLPGGGLPPASGSGDQPAAPSSSPVLETSSPLGGSSKKDSPKQKANKHKHKHHRTKTSRHRAKTKKH